MISIEIVVLVPTTKLGNGEKLDNDNAYINRRITNKNQLLM
jgi:hypothetical protein